MNWLTPRRRFLMTVPLALLLPSGLLTYLGVQMVGLTELPYTNQINNIKDLTLSKIRNETREKIDQLVQDHFRTSVEMKLDELFFDSTSQEDDGFETHTSLEFIDSIFIFLSDESFLFYHPANQEHTHWQRTQDVLTAFSDSLGGRIKSEMNIDPNTINSSEYIYFVSNRDRLYHSDRKLAAFKIFRTNTEPIIMVLLKD